MGCEKKRAWNMKNLKNVKNRKQIISHAEIMNKIEFCVYAFCLLLNSMYQANALFQLNHFTTINVDVDT